MAFGIGTHFTNDVGHPAMNIVIKLWSMTIRNHSGSRIIHATKIPDDIGKATGEREAIDHALYELGLSTAGKAV